MEKNKIFKKQQIDYNTEEFKMQLENFIKNAMNQLPISNVYYVCDKIFKNLQIEYYMNLNRILSTIDTQKNQKQNSVNQQQEQYNQDKEN